MFFAAPARPLVVPRPGSGTPSTFLCRLRVRAMPPARPASPAPAAIAGVFSFLAVDPTTFPVLFAAPIDASFAFATVPLLLEELDDVDRFRAVDPALLWVPRRLCEPLELARALVVRLLVDALPRGFDLPPPDFRVLLLCCATRSSFTAIGIRLPGTEADYRNLRILGGNVRKPPPRAGSSTWELTSDVGIKVSPLRRTQENGERRCVSSAETQPSS